MLTGEEIDVFRIPLNVLCCLDRVAHDLDRIGIVDKRKKRALWFVGFFGSLL